MKSQWIGYTLNGAHHMSRIFVIRDADTWEPVQYGPDMVPKMINRGRSHTIYTDGDMTYLDLFKFGNGMVSVASDCMGFPTKYGPAPMPWHLDPVL